MKKVFGVQEFRSVKQIRMPGNVVDCSEIRMKIQTTIQRSEDPSEVPRSALSSKRLLMQIFLPEQPPKRTDGDLAELSRGHLPDLRIH